MSSSLRVSPLLNMLSSWVVNHPCFWTAVGNAESTILADKLVSIPLKSPVYICGLARSGSTLLLELLASYPAFVSHRYRDNPFVFTPYWWNKTVALTPFRDLNLRERAHGDGMMINSDSPEAMEEIIWMAFFKNIHSAQNPMPLLEYYSHTAFESFYADHLRKLILVRGLKEGRSRYLCKNNYNVTRMPYLLRLFPDARFIIPIREPAAHIASLMRQHARFSEAGTKSSRVVRHMNAGGHFEFGLNRIPMFVGDDTCLREIRKAWEQGNEVRGWALYWNMVYSFIYRQLEAEMGLKQATIIVCFETMCASPEETIRQITAHVNLAADEQIIGNFSRLIRMPDYYESSLSDEDRHCIADITRDTARLYGF